MKMKKFCFSESHVWQSVQKLLRNFGWLADNVSVSGAASHLFSVVVPPAVNLSVFALQATVIFPKCQVNNIVETTRHVSDLRILHGVEILPAAKLALIASTPTANAVVFSNCTGVLATGFDPGDLVKVNEHCRVIICGCCGGIVTQLTLVILTPTHCLAILPGCAGVSMTNAELNGIREVGDCLDGTGILPTDYTAVIDDRASLTGPNIQSECFIDQEDWRGSSLIICPPARDAAIVTDAAGLVTACPKDLQPTKRDSKLFARVISISPAMSYISS